MAFPVMIGVLIWIFPEKLVSFMVEPVKEKKEDMMSPAFDLDSAQIIVLTTAGLILLVNAISSLISALTVYAVLSDLPTSSAWHEIISQLVNSAIQIIDYSGVMACIWR
ncbi:MAG: hypothetical protein NC238_07765 [Dehalobacter sp.]|nr:hypothetical protein [Dehalobacter sp.]